MVIFHGYVSHNQMVSMGETIQMSDIWTFTIIYPEKWRHSNDQKKIGLQFYGVQSGYTPWNLDIFADVYFVNGLNLPTILYLMTHKYTSSEM